MREFAGHFKRPEEFDASAPKALEGVRILDFTWVVAGPYATRMLADMGAEVIKVQSHATSRGADSNAGAAFSTFNRNKYSVTLNLRKPEAVELARRLAKVSDVVVDNFSARVMRNWGLDYDSLKAVKPDIIAVSMSGLGHSGPWRDHVSYGPTLQALSGMTYLMGFPGRPPQGFGYSYADHAGGVTGAVAILAALEHKAKTGEGQWVDLGQLEAMAALMGPVFLDHAVNGAVPEPAGNRLPSRPAAPYGAYRCKDDDSGLLSLTDRWIAIGVTDDGEWRALVKAMGNPGWATEPRFATQESRSANADALDRLVEGWTRDKDPFEAARVLTDAGVPAGVVQNALDLQRDPQLSHLDYWWEADRRDVAPNRFDGYPAHLSETPPALWGPAPWLGEHNQRVFGELLGLTGEEIKRLEEDEVLW
jgi:crotonobetainyl-CoA:carnitine CoA-transferase CaiB-like acyl-CoA transferase